MVKHIKPDKTTNWQVFIVLFVLLIFSFLMFLSSPAVAQNRAIQQVTPTLVSESVPTETPFPEEWIKNARQTDGIALGGTLLLLIIIAGTMGILLQKPETKNSKKRKTKNSAAR